MAAYIAIDMKSFYASVECVYRGLDPLEANLLVADESRSDKTICLAVSPSLKAKGVPSRPRLFEAKQAIKLWEAKNHQHLDVLIAVPRMAEYVRVSTQIYSILLRYAGEAVRGRSRGGPSAERAKKLRRPAAFYENSHRNKCRNFLTILVQYAKISIRAGPAPHGWKFYRKGGKSCLLLTSLFVREESR